MTPYSQYVHQLAKKYIKKGDAVFDCGCGNGLSTAILKKYSDNVIGGDFDNRTDSKLDINFRKITDKNYGGENEFDVVSAFDVIEHVKDDFGFLRELIKITKAGGYIIIGTPNRKRLSNIIRSWLGHPVTYPCRIGYHFESGGEIIHLREYTLEDMRKMESKIKNARITEEKAGFLGLYTKFGAVGFRNNSWSFLKKYRNHLFVVFKKM